MSAPKPGEFITAKCSRCNDITGHVIMIVLGGQITKVECKACGSVHKYRDAVKQPAAVKREPAVRHVKAGQTREESRVVASESRPARAPRTPGTGAASAAAKSRKASAAKIESAWQESMFKHSGETATPYSMSSSFQPRMLVEHPLFGLGEVLEVAKPDKMTVLFQDGMKILRCKL